jgi:hypothetical protein
MTPLPSGPELFFDLLNIVNVTLIGGTVSSVTDADLLNGANLIAINGANGWELLQFGVATLVSGTTYNLTRLLRARYGTYLSMGAGASSRLVYLGQSTNSIVAWINTELGLSIEP